MQTDAALKGQFIYNAWNLDVQIYKSTEWNDYVSWLNSAAGAGAAVDEGNADLKSSVLEAFKALTSSYDGMAIKVTLDFNTLTVNNQEVAICIAEQFIKAGIHCFGVGTGPGATTATESFSYWLPSEKESDLTGSWDLVGSAAND